MNIVALIFIETDPIQIPKTFENKEDIEISGFLAALTSMGTTSDNYQKCQGTNAIWDYAPYDFIMHATDSEFDTFQIF